VRRRRKFLVKSLPYLSLDAGSASKGGIIYVQRMPEGTRIDPEDAMLADIAQKVRAETNARATIEKPFRRGPYIRH